VTNNPQFKDNMGVINGQITKLVDKPEQLKEFMKDKTVEQKRKGRIHFKMIKGLNEQNNRRR
jgi:hypothetical protein